MRNKRHLSIVPTRRPAVLDLDALTLEELGRLTETVRDWQLLAENASDGSPAAENMWQEFCGLRVEVRTVFLRRWLPRQA